MQYADLASFLNDFAGQNKDSACILTFEDDGNLPTGKSLVIVMVNDSIWEKWVREPEEREDANPTPSAKLQSLN